jgi:hypothetical protein
MARDRASGPSSRSAYSKYVMLLRDFKIIAIEAPLEKVSMHLNGRCNTPQSSELITCAGSRDVMK